MIKDFETIPVTEESHPFCTASQKCSLQDFGYLEQEMLIRGTSDIYGWNGNEKITLANDVPYVNRMLVRKPVGEKISSRNIIVEILNSTSFIDFDRVWVLTHKHIIREGDTYIGITSKPNVLPALRKFDYERYRDLCWDSPLGATLPQEKLGNMDGASQPETEDGLVWDMIIDLAETLRQSSRTPVPGSENAKLVLSGWSQSGAYLIRFLNDFAYEESREQPLFDGYFSCGGASSCMPDLNQNYGQTAMKTSRKIAKVCEPFLEVHTESENQLWGNSEARGENSNSDDFMYRIYDIAGATHDSTSTMTDYYRDDRDVYITGIIPSYPGKEIYPNNYPLELVFHAALEHLYRWIHNGVEPPLVPGIEVDDQKRNRKNKYGNSVGGWVLPQLEFPVCTYNETCTPIRPDFSFASTLFGHLEPFSGDELAAMYDSLENYEKLVGESADRCIEKGLLLKADKGACVENSLETAKSFGLG